MSDGNGKREVLLIKEFQKEHTSDAGKSQGKIMFYYASYKESECERRQKVSEGSVECVKSLFQQKSIQTEHC